MSRVSACLVCCLFLVVCCRKAEPRIGVVASTALISAIVQAVGDGRFAVRTAAPAVSCPGEFDMKPADVVAASRARLVVNQGWEPWFPNFVRAVENAASDASVKPRFVTSNTKGNWMIPEVHKAAVAEMTELLAELEPDQAAFFRGSAARYTARIDSATLAVRALFAMETLPTVLASEKQASFLTWLGFRVVGTYGAMEDCSAQELAGLARTALDSSVALVVDNLQSGPEAGLPLAQALGVRHVTLTNFPLDRGYVETLLDNAAALAGAVQSNAK